MDGNLYIQTTVFIYSTPAVAGNRTGIRSRQRVGQVPLTPFEREGFSPPGNLPAFAI
jgi:hypothetical protein